ncbi:MAG: hypothetical protein KGI84_00600 [Elusimicrobia bacterium]|nr:hypothetical protein [Elusimicrobiota bacterium]
MMNSAAVKKVIFSVAAFWGIMALAGAAAAQQVSGPAAGEFGIGIEAGQPSGAAAKYWLDKDSAVDAGFGESNGDAALHADLVWHAWNVLPQPQQGKLGIYFGAGPRLQFASDTEFAVRTFVGTSYWLGGHPVELFAEVGPVFQMTQGGGVYADGAVGARFYFNWRGPGS